MSTFYNKVTYLSYLTCVSVAIVVGVILYSEIKFALTLIIAMVLGIALNMLVMFVMVKLENNKAFINRDVKYTVLKMNRVKPVDSFVFINSIDMLCSNSTDSRIVKVIASVVEKVKEKNRYTYYIDTGDDSMNVMVDSVCNYKNAKLYSVKEFEDELKVLRKGKSIVYFNVVALSKLIHEFGFKDVYDNCVVIGEVCASLSRYKQFVPYMETMYQLNGLVEDKTSIMLEFYLDVINNREIVVKDLLSLGAK